MARDLPNYERVSVPREKQPAEYSTHERRAAVLEEIVDAGEPSAVHQGNLADRFDVHESTISRDMDRIGESLLENIGAENAVIDAYAHMQQTVRDLREEGRIKWAWEVRKDWLDFLLEHGAVNRAAEEQKVDMDVRSRRSEVSYRVVREGDGEPLPTTETDDGEDVVDYEELGFTSAPEDVPVDAVEEVGRDE
jgi:hypothetical protein